MEEGTEDGRSYVKKGCIDDNLHHKTICGVKKLKGSNPNSGRFHGECCSQHLCNNETIGYNGDSEEHLGSFKYNQNDSDDMSPDPVMMVSIVATLALSILMFGAIIYFLRRKRYASKNGSRQIAMSSVTGAASDVERSLLWREDQTRTTGFGDSTLREVMDPSGTCGSGSGLPFLVPRTLSKEITLVEQIGKGKYGKVWRGKWQEDDVAVKIFELKPMHDANDNHNNICEASFDREREIYNIVMLRHQNVLGYIGSDVEIKSGDFRYLWIVTQYHPLGSLYKHLSHECSENPISLKEALLILKTAVSGLTHLHTEIFGTKGKPAIAHRDIKSKNILLKNRVTACVADFGLAVTHTQSTGELNISKNQRVGTKRYMAPEILNQTMKSDIFEAYKMSDIYSFALVMWETFRRVEGQDLEYRPPFYDCVPSDPSLSDMKQAVVVEHRRPSFPESWHQDPVSYTSSLTLFSLTVRFYDRRCKMSCG